MYPFFAYLNRLKLIRRWSLMRNTQPENDAEHSLQVAMMAHAIAVIGRNCYHRDTNPEHVMALAVYHDATEVMTGDLPTPVKYHSDDLRGAYSQLEARAADSLKKMLPENIQAEFGQYLVPEKGYDHTVVKAADRISAYIKCLEEKRAGNREFDYAAERILASIEQIELPEVRDFMQQFLPSFELTLDELNHPGQKEE